MFSSFHHRWSWVPASLIGRVTQPLHKCSAMIFITVGLKPPRLSLGAKPAIAWRGVCSGCCNGIGLLYWLLLARETFKLPCWGPSHLFYKCSGYQMLWVHGCMRIIVTHARFCVDVFYALYINFHSFIHTNVFDRGSEDIVQKIIHWNFVQVCCQWSWNWRQQLKSGHWTLWLVMFSLVQDGIYAPRKAHLRSTSHSEVSPTLPLKQFQCSTDWRWPSLILLRKIV